MLGRDGRLASGRQLEVGTARSDPGCSCVFLATLPRPEAPLGRRWAEGRRIGSPRGAEADMMLGATLPSWPVAPTWGGRSRPRRSSSWTTLRRGPDA
jgi:hypothetical protein